MYIPCIASFGVVACSGGSSIYMGSVLFIMLLQKIFSTSSSPVLGSSHTGNTSQWHHRVNVVSLVYWGAKNHLERENTNSYRSHSRIRVCVQVMKLSQDEGILSIGRVCNTTIPFNAHRTFFSSSPLPNFLRLFSLSCSIDLLYVE